MTSKETANAVEQVMKASAEMTPAEKFRQALALRKNSTTRQRPRTEQSPDSKLLKLGRAFDEISPSLTDAHRRELEADELSSECSSPKVFEKLRNAQAEIEILDRVMDPLLDSIRIARARTPTGLRVKARAAVWSYTLGLDPSYPDADPDRADGMAWSVVRDLIPAS